jgi:small ligand-binding sensory domain FIST
VPPAPISENFGPDLETEQDICVASTVVQGATIAVYFLAFFNSGQNSWHDLIERIVTPSAGDFPMGVAPPSVISCSDYICDCDDPTTMSNEGITSSFIDAIHMAFEDAAVQASPSASPPAIKVPIRTSEAAPP